MTTPLISIVTTVYNGEQYLDAAIESIMNQDFANFEYIIVDDASTDGTPDIIRRWASRDRRILVRRLPENVGIAGAFNCALELASGRYVCRHDADDVCTGSRLRQQVELLESDPAIALVTANCIDIDAPGKIIREHIVENPPEVIAFLLHFRNCIVGAGGQAMYRVDTARQMGGFNEALRASVDYDFFCRLSKHGNFAVLPFVGLKRRLHPQQTSQRIRPLQLRNSSETSRKMISELLGREILCEEATAVTAISQYLGDAGVGKRAQRVFRECFARFTGTTHQRDLVRRAIASWWVHSAAASIRNGGLREPMRQLAYSVLWHPSSLQLCAGIMMVKFRTLLRRQLPSHDPSSACRR